MAFLFFLTIKMYFSTLTYNKLTMEWYIKVLKQYADFNGRARRKEFWMFVLINTIISIVIMAVDGFLGLNIGMLPYGYLYMIYSLAILLPNLAVSVRRMHDIGKSGWFLLIAFIPLIGAIWLIVLSCKEGDQETNEYGPDPKNPIDEINEIGTVQ